MIPILGLAQEEYSYTNTPVSEQVIINDSLGYRIEFREYTEYKTKGKSKYFEFDCTQRIGSVIRKVRITYGWGMRVIDEEMDSTKGIKYEYTYVAPFNNLEDKARKYIDKLKVMTNPMELLEIPEIKGILDYNKRYNSKIEYYDNHSRLVSQIEIKNDKVAQVDSARYEQGRLVYSKNWVGTTHHIRYDLDSIGNVRTVYDSVGYEQTITKFQEGRPIETIYMTRGEIRERLRTTYSGDTLTIKAYYDPRGAIMGPRRMHIRKWNAKKNVKTYCVDGSIRYVMYFDEKKRLIKEVWRVQSLDEVYSTRTYQYLSGR